MSDGGKGSRPRPFSVDAETYASNWDRIFGRKDLPSGPDPEVPGAQRVTSTGELEEFQKGNWTQIENRS